MSGFLKFVQNPALLMTRANPTESIHRRKRQRLAGFRQCIHNVKKKKQKGETIPAEKTSRPLLQPGKNSCCDAKISFAIAGDRHHQSKRFSSQNIANVNAFPMLLRIEYTHTVNDRLSSRGLICQNDFLGSIFKVWFVNIFACSVSRCLSISHNWQTLHVLVFRVVLGVHKH